MTLVNYQSHVIVVILTNHVGHWYLMMIREIALFDQNSATLLSILERSWIQRQRFTEYQSPLALCSQRSLGQSERWLPFPILPSCKAILPKKDRRLLHSRRFIVELCFVNRGSKHCTFIGCKVDGIFYIVCQKVFWCVLDDLFFFLFDLLLCFFVVISNLH